MILYYLYSLLLITANTAALDNGVALTPPMGFNSYMASALQNEQGLRKAAEFIVNSGMRDLGYKYINTDEGWEESSRDSQGNLQWNSTLYPSGLPTFIAFLHKNMSLLFGIYGAASGVSCGEKPGQLYFEKHDAAQYASWGVDFVKSDNCASYAMDSSVRYRAMRDALNTTGRPMVLSIEPFSIRLDLAQSSQVANLWRTGVDIEGTFEAVMDRADVADKWAPLAGPKLGWNDPDMTNVHGGLKPGENRLYFGLWAIMKAPLLISSDLLNLDKNVLDIITNVEVIRINQDELGIPARKVQIDGLSLPWHVGVEDCAFPDGSLLYSRSVAQNVNGVPRAGPGTVDTRQWTVLATGTINGNMPNYQIRNEATKRCLSQSNGTTVVLLPCDATSNQLWIFDKGISTVTSITNVEAKKALAIAPSVLYAQIHDKDKYSVSDLAYGEGGLILVEPMDQDSCNSRWCENYAPDQMWYYSPMEGMLRHALYTSSMNHIEDDRQDNQDGYLLTQKVPTFRHHCLAHALSTGNKGTQSGTREVWAGPLAGGNIVVAFVNRGENATSISINLDFLEGSSRSYVVRDSWKARDLFVVNSGEHVTAKVSGHDIALLRLIPLPKHDQPQTAAA